MPKTGNQVSAAVIAEIAKLRDETPSVIKQNDLAAAKKHRRLITLAVKNALALKTNFDKSVKTAREVDGEDFLAGLELFRKVNPDAAKPGRKPAVKMSDEDIFAGLLDGTLIEDENGKIVHAEVEEEDS